MCRIRKEKYVEKRERKEKRGRRREKEEERKKRGELSLPKNLYIIQRVDPRFVNNQSR